MLQALNSDPFITHFIYASESCIPITSFDAATKALQNSDGSTAQSSWINYYNIPTNGYAKDSQVSVLIINFDCGCEKLIRMACFLV